MNNVTLRLFEKTKGNFEIRCFQGENLISQHPMPADDLTAFIDRVEKEYGGPALLEERLGKDLYSWLEQVSGGFLGRIRATSQALCLHIDTAAGLRHLPWELLHDGDVFLCAIPRRPFTPARRVTPYSRDDAAADNRPLRVLFMASSPEKVEPVLKFEIEEARILEATRHQGLELVVEESGSLEGLKRVVNDYPVGYFDVVHLTGHADIEDGVPGFWLENEVGAPDFADADRIADCFGSRFPRLLFLSGCRSGQGPSGGGVPSLAESLVDAGVPAVLGWALPVGDISATSAATDIYGRLANGEDLDESVARARMALKEADSRYWHLLRLYGNATPMTACVTPKNTPGRERLKRREAARAFLEAANGRRIPVCGRADFVGRRRLLQKALRCLQTDFDDPGGAAGILLKGMGGLGKSSLAARICDRMSPTHDHWVWYGGVDEMEVRRVFTDKLGSTDANAVLNESGLSFKHRLARILENHLDRPALFVFDDFEHNAVTIDPGKPGGRPVPRTRENGELVLKNEARAVLGTLIEAISESGTESRVMVTCRYGAGLPLVEFDLDSLKGADLEKKIDALEAFGKNAGVDEALRNRARELAAGNPRLLEWLDKVLLDRGTDHETVLNRLAARTEEFREDILLEALLEQLRTPVLRTLALLSLYRLPVPLAAVTALTDDSEAPAHLTRLGNLGLVEQVPVPGGAGVSAHEPTLHYFASPLLWDHLSGELEEAEIPVAQKKAARVLKKLWWEEDGGIGEDQSLEIRRLALAGKEWTVAAEITDRLASVAIYRARYRDARDWCRETLSQQEDWRVLYQLARAEKVLGDSECESHYRRALELAPGISEETSQKDIREYTLTLYDFAELKLQRGLVEDALKMWTESLGFLEKIDDVHGKADMLSNIARAFADQGDLGKALNLWTESLGLYKKIDDVRGKAATLTNMARAVAHQSDLEKALQLWTEAIELFEEIGDVRGKAVTLTNMAGLIVRRGDVEKALKLWAESLKLDEEIGDVRGKAVTLNNMAWLFARRGDVEKALKLWAESLRLSKKIGDVRGRAITLTNMARIFHQQGDVEKAMQLWAESLGLFKKIGDVQGTAATLASMAWLAGQQGNTERAKDLNRQALEALVRNGAWLDVVTVLGNMSTILDESEALGCLSQALWVSLRVHVPLMDSLNLCGRLIGKAGGVEAESGPLLAGAMAFLIGARGENHPQREDIARQVSGILGACAQARNIPQEKAQEWMETEGLLDPDRLLPALDALLEGWISEWHFDRTVFGQRGGRR